MMNALHKFLFCHLLTSLGQSALGSEIIDGKIAPENSLPYMVSLQSFWGQHICGGSLIRKNFVLTAAHCDGNLAKVVLGTQNLRGAGVVTSIAMTHKHPAYVTAGQGNDIMLLKLSRDVPLSDKVKLIRLPRANSNIGENQMCQVAGWGRIHDGGPSVAELRVVDVPVIGQQVCRQTWGHLPNNVICAGGYRTTKGACQGDSGGPLVYKGRAVGIASYIHGSCINPSLAPNVYTDTSRFIPWINSILRKNDS